MSAKSVLRTRTGQPLPVVTCPGCQIPMTPLTKKPVLLTEFIEVTYHCDKCDTETRRTIKDD
jgi:hypothetical protein